jgi:hypothetical protein
MNTHQWLIMKFFRNEVILGTSKTTSGSMDIHLNGWVSSRINDLATHDSSHSDDISRCCHCSTRGIPQNNGRSEHIYLFMMKSN